MTARQPCQRDIYHPKITGLVVHLNTITVNRTTVHFAETNDIRILKNTTVT